MFLLLAAVTSFALIAAGFVAPFYSGSGSECSATPGGGTVCHDLEVESETLVEVNGSGILAPLSVPLLAVVLVSVALSLGQGGPWRVAAWILVGLLWLFCVAAIVSIGVLIVPTALLLTAAVATASRGGDGGD